ncbi:hypothetical protein BU26DRAFT_519977 [Trematosphaeria pertusa]|uniref:Uncharacterized protein n=1 Tax=Trematosphaeria pertusa TaxID=390896 RepID=A0A6A6ICY1_9PLEO|nr:uncharacterized protein BU26DRAFT_519977 [Trematosphaeria pertusa]KAF2248251.1 hypothetical protein BU26DRAFT_519977 [Trematosphaeria pertusa]
MERHRFLILRSPIAGQDLPKLLGRLTLDYTSPLDNSVPDDPTSFTKDHLRGVVEETAAEVWGTAQDGSKIQAALKPFGEVSISTDGEKSYSFDAAMIKTHQLRDHDAVFELIFEKHKKDINQLMDSIAPRLGILPEKVYMVIGYKSVENASFSGEESESLSVKASGEAPVGATANAVAPGVTPLNATASLSGEAHRSTKSGHKGSLTGETGVAVEYRTLKRSWILAWTRKKSYGSIYSIGVKYFGGGDAMGKETTDEQENEEEEGDELMLELEDEDVDGYELCDGVWDDFYVPKPLISN